MIEVSTSVVLANALLGGPAALQEVNDMLLTDPDELFHLGQTALVLEDRFHRAGGVSPRVLERLSALADTYSRYEGTTSLAGVEWGGVAMATRIRTREDINGLTELLRRVPAPKFQTVAEATRRALIFLQKLTPQQAMEALMQRAEPVLDSLRTDEEGNGTRAKKTGVKFGNGVWILVESRIDKTSGRGSLHAVISGPPTPQWREVLRGQFYKMTDVVSPYRGALESLARRFPGAVLRFQDGAFYYDGQITGGIVIDGGSSVLNLRLPLEREEDYAEWLRIFLQAQAAVLNFQPNDGRKV